MGKSGNPANSAKKVSGASDFKKRAAGEVKELPSGLFVRLKRVELQTFIFRNNANASVPNPLMELVSDALEKGQKADIPQMMGMDEGKLNLEMVEDMYEIVNSIVCEAVVEPKVHPVPTEEDLEAHNSKNPDNQLEDPEDLRSDDLVYVDEVEELDKMFIFQWLMGGVDDVATFREQAGADLVALAEGQGAARSAE